MQQLLKLFALSCFVIQTTQCMDSGAIPNAIVALTIRNSDKTTTEFTDSYLHSNLTRLCAAEPRTLQVVDSRIGAQIRLSPDELEKLHRALLSSLAQRTDGKVDVALLQPLPKSIHDIVYGPEQMTSQGSLTTRAFGTKMGAQTAHEITDKNPVILTLKKGIIITRVTLDDIRAQFGQFCWIDAQNITVINGRDERQNTLFKDFSTQDKQQLKEHILSFFTATEVTASKIHTFKDGTKALIPTDCIIDLSRVAPWPVHCERSIDVTYPQPDNSDNENDNNSKEASAVAEQEDLSRGQAHALPQDVRATTARATLVQKVFNPTTLTVGAACLLLGWIVAKHSQPAIR